MQTRRAIRADPSQQIVSFVLAGIAAVACVFGHRLYYRLYLSTGFKWS